MSSTRYPSDPEKSEKIRRFLSQLESSQSQIVYKCLVEIRTKFAVGDCQKAKSLVSLGLVPKLVSLLERPNSKIVDVALSILGNLTLHKKPRDKVTKR
jgi:Armadillo/beta-catenin-like repeat